MGKMKEERGLLENLDLPGDVRDLKPGDVHYLLDHLRHSEKAHVTPVLYHAAREYGYEWRTHDGLAENMSPQARLYLDALVRLNEIYDSRGKK